MLLWGDNSRGDALRDESIQEVVGRMNKHDKEGLSLEAIPFFLTYCKHTNVVQEPFILFSIGSLLFFTPEGVFWTFISISLNLTLVIMSPSRARLKAEIRARLDDPPTPNCAPKRNHPHDAVSLTVMVICLLVCPFLLLPCSYLPFVFLNPLSANISSHLILLHNTSHLPFGPTFPLPQFSLSLASP